MREKFKKTVRSTDFQMCGVGGVTPAHTFLSGFLIHEPDYTLDVTSSLADNRLVELTARRRSIQELGGALLAKIFFDHLLRLRAEESVDTRQPLTQFDEALSSGAVLERFGELHGLISLDGLARAFAEPRISLRITFAQIDEIF